jgi:hypothetical protein
MTLIERGLGNPPIAALQKITTSYGTTIRDPLGAPNHRAQMLVRAGDRQVSGLTPRVKLKHLNFGQHVMQVHLLTVEPGAGSDESYQHGGSSCLLEGVLEVWLDGMERYTLSPCDVLYFESADPPPVDQPGRSSGGLPGVNTPPTFQLGLEPDIVLSLLALRTGTAARIQGVRQAVAEEGNT